MINRYWFESAIFLDNFFLDLDFYFNKSICIEEGIKAIEVIDGEFVLPLVNAMSFLDDLTRYYNVVTVFNNTNGKKLIYQKYQDYSFNLKIRSDKTAVVFRILLYEMKHIFDVLSHSKSDCVLFYEKSYGHEFEMVLHNQMIFFRYYIVYDPEDTIIMKISLEKFKDQYFERFLLLNKMLDQIFLKLNFYPW